MKLISHRGNIKGINPKEENKPSYIENALERGYDVEVDVWWHDNGFWLGHDSPQYETDLSFLSTSGLWIHAKNLEALYEKGYSNRLLNYAKLNCFWHQEDDYTLTSHQWIWAYPSKSGNKRTICVLPETVPMHNVDVNEFGGICSDYIKSYRKLA
jgi:hypothetical protein